jgi:hypothetical protein
MRTNMFRSVVELLMLIPSSKLGSICDLFQKLLSKESGEAWWQEFSKFRQKKACWTGEVVETILEHIGAVDISLATGKFIARKKFVRDTSSGVRVKISGWGDNFEKNFLGKIEEVSSVVNLCCHRLKKWSRSILIISELGGDDAAETMLAEMYALMEKQGNGESGDLLTNGGANIFFIRDVAGVLWTVYCYWVDVGWRLDANPVVDQSEWYGARPVFSRDSLAA